MRLLPHHPYFSRQTLAAAVAGSMVVLSSPLVAQELEEITVTAERRELRLQDTPISIMAYSGEKLEALGIDDMFELATNAPNLDIKVVEVAAGDTEISITFLGRLFREYADRAAGTVASEQGSLRTPQYLDPLHVKHPHDRTGCARHEHIVYVEAYTAFAGGAAGTANAADLEDR